MTSQPSLPRTLAKPSRRSVVGGLAGLGVAGMSAGRTMGSGRSHQHDGAPALPQDDLLALVSHATQGFTIDELGRANTLGYDTWLNEQLDPALIDDSAMDQVLAGYTNLFLSAQDLYNLHGPPNNSTPDLLRDLRSLSILRSFQSKRQLHERLVEFWSDHFNIYQNEDTLQRILKFVDDRDNVRAVLMDPQSTFYDLLLANARGASMSYYLDNYASSVGSINENYGRELLELHTLGLVGQPYSERDVKEASRCFTGWAFQPIKSGSLGDFLFIAARHDQGTKKVVGLDIPANGGVNDGLLVLDMLAKHPVTIARLARKLCSWLLRVDPPPAVVKRVEDAYVATGGNLRAMAEAALRAETLHEAKPWLNPKLKRPFHLLVGILRQTKAQITDFSGLQGVVDAMGHTPFDWHTPDGAPDRMQFWGGDVLNRWALPSILLTNKLPGVSIPNSSVADILAGVPLPDVAGRLDRYLCGGAMRHQDRALLQSYVDGISNWNVTSARESIALAMASPSYQLY